MKIDILNEIIQDFLNNTDFATFIDEAEMRSELAQKIREADLDVEEEKTITTKDDETYRVDIVVSFDSQAIPIELKFENTSIDEYKEDEEKCNTYLDNFSDVDKAYCIFVSNVNHQNYYEGEWHVCQGNEDYHYLWLEF